jgi:predicted HTH transcriptional regulator
MPTLLDEIVANGFAAIQEMVEQGREETLHLEFKTFSNHSSGNLMKEDRRLLAKSICGLCNADGGVLILGIETIRQDGVDIANGLKRFENIETLRNRIVSALPEMVSPQNLQISVVQIPDPSQAGGGFLAISVPTSESRPHMSIPHHQYFRRGSDGTRVLEHGEVRELMFAPREAKLSLQYRMRNTLSTGDYKFRV